MLASPLRRSAHSAAGEGDTRLHPITWLIVAAIGAWALSDAVLLTYALYHPAQHFASTGWTFGRFVNHVRTEAPTMVLNLVGAVLVECLTRVWRRLQSAEGQLRGASNA